LKFRSQNKRISFLKFTLKKVKKKTTFKYLICKVFAQTFIKIYVRYMKKPPFNIDLLINCVAASVMYDNV